MSEVPNNLRTPEGFLKESGGRANHSVWIEHSSVYPKICIGHDENVTPITLHFYKRGDVVLEVGKHAYTGPCFYKVEDNVLKMLVLLAKSEPKGTGDLAMKLVRFLAPAVSHFYRVGHNSPTGNTRYMEGANNAVMAVHMALSGYAIRVTRDHLVTSLNHGRLPKPIL